MNEDVAVDAVECAALRALKQILVDGVLEVSLAGEAVRRLLLVGQLDEVRDGKEMVIGAGEVRRKHQRQATNDALDGQLAVFRLALRAEVAGGGQLARLRRLQVAHAHRQHGHVLLVGVLDQPVRESHLDERTFLRDGCLQRLDVLEQLILEVRLVQDGAVDSLRLLGQEAHDSRLRRQTDDRAADVLLLQAGDRLGDVAGIAGRETSQHHQNLPTRVRRNHFQSLQRHFQAVLQ